MTTTKFFNDYGAALDGIVKDAFKIDDYSICSNGVRAKVTTTKYDSLDGFVDDNGVFYFENLGNICENLPPNMPMDEFELVIDLALANDDGVYGIGKISYRNCFRIVNCNSRERTFGEEELVNDGILVFNNVKVGDLRKVEKEDKKDTAEKSDISASDAFKVFADMLRAFSNAKADDDGNLSKTLSFNINGNKCHFEKTVNGKKTVYDGTLGDVK